MLAMINVRDSLQKLNIPVSDFSFDKYLSQHYASLGSNNKSIITKRKKNLSDITQQLNKNKVKYWLTGKTLMGAVSLNELIDDHDDDIGIDEGSLALFIKLLPILIGDGFEVIRATKENDMISLYRDGRYIDVCIFKKKESTGMGTKQKHFPPITSTK